MTLSEKTVKQIAQTVGIEPEYTDVFGNKHRIPEGTLRRLTNAFGVHINGSEEGIKATLEAYQSRSWQQPLPPVHVSPMKGDDKVRFSVHLPEDVYKQTFHWSLTEEKGPRHQGQFRPSDLKYEGRIKADAPGKHIGKYLFELPVTPSLGYHTFNLTGDVLGEALDVEMCLIVTPDCCYLPEALKEGSRVWGMTAQLYSVRSRRNWGVGDFTDLTTLVDFCADQEAGILGLNPLHELFPNNPASCSPYSPSSRMFLNVMYLDVEAIPDFFECEAAQQMVLAPGFQAQLSALREKDMIDYNGVGAAKFPVLELLYQSFRERHLRYSTQYASEFRAFVAEGGEKLETFALYEALQERFYKEDPNMWGWLVWPEAYRDPQSDVVREFAENNRERLEFFMYLQWQAEQQLHASALRALDRGMPVGLYLDLAVGADRGGAEVWANQELFSLDTKVGCPPDELNQKGQDWGLPPMIPEKLVEAAYAPFTDILRENMKFAGALRIDHFMALMRLFWIPQDVPCADGAYVKYPFEDMLAVLALESHRNQCLVIGEDLGTVPPQVREKMAEWGILSYKVFLFEKNEEGTGEFFAPTDYPARALVTLSTHDIPTLAGYWQSEDIQLRTDLDLYPTPELRTRQIKERVLERMGILAALEKEGLLPEGMTPDPSTVPTMTTELNRAIHTFLSRTPSMIQVVQLEDILEQTAQVNMPGTVDEHPNWRRKLSAYLEDLAEDSRVARLAEALNRTRKPPATAPGKSSPLASGR